MLQLHKKNKISSYSSIKKENVILLRLSLKKQQKINMSKQKRAKTQIQEIKQLKSMSKHAQKLLSTNSSSTICHSYRVKTEKDRSNNQNYINKYLKNSKMVQSIDILSGRYSLGNISNSKILHCRKRYYDSLQKIEEEVVEKNVLKKQYIELSLPKEKQKKPIIQTQDKIKKEKNYIKFSNIQELVDRLEKKRQCLVVNSENDNYKFNQIRRIRMKPKPKYKPQLLIVNKKLKNIPKTLQPIALPETCKNDKKKEFIDLNIDIKGWTKQNKSQKNSLSEQQSYTNDFQNY